MHPDSDQTIRGEEANWEDWLKTLSRDESLAVYARRFRRPSDSDVELEEDLPPLPVATAGNLEVDLPPLPVTVEEPKPVKKANHKPLIVRIPKLAIKVPEKMAMLEMPVEMELQEGGCGTGSQGPESILRRLLRSAQAGGEGGCRAASHQNLQPRKEDRQASSAYSPSQSRIPMGRA